MFPPIGGIGGMFEVRRGEIFEGDFVTAAHADDPYIADANGPMPAVLLLNWEAVKHGRVIIAADHD